MSLIGFALLRYSNIFHTFAFDNIFIFISNFLF